MGVKKTQSIWDDITKMILKFLRDHWWKIAILLFVAGMAISGFSFKTKNTEFKKEGIDVWQKK